MQAAYRGRPLYYFANDEAAGDTDTTITDTTTDETTTDEFKAWYVDRRKVPMARTGLPVRSEGDVFAVMSTGVAKRTSCHPLTVSAVKVADASWVPASVHSLPTCVPVLLVPL